MVPSAAAYAAAVNVCSNYNTQQCPPSRHGVGRYVCMFSNKLHVQLPHENVLNSFGRFIYNIILTQNVFLRWIILKKKKFPTAQRRTSCAGPRYNNTTGERGEGTQGNLLPLIHPPAHDVTYRSNSLNVILNDFVQSYTSSVSLSKSKVRRTD